MRIDPLQLNASLGVRLLSVDEASRRSGISRHVLLSILGRQARRDEDGLVDIEPETARRLANLLETVPPILSVTVPPQGPPKRRKVANYSSTGEFLPGDPLPPSTGKVGRV
jgi:hypothetical protein